jgi:hypothetical protein
MEPHEFRLDDDDGVGKKRKHTAWMAHANTDSDSKAKGSLFQNYFSVSSDGKVSRVLHFHFFYLLLKSFHPIPWRDSNP